MINHFKYLLIILFSSFSFATTIHVATTGSDDTGDGTEANPYATIQKGVDISADGDTVLVHPGTYEAVNNVNDIFLISTQGPEQTVIDANFQSTTVMLNTGSQNIFISGFTIVGGICGYNEYYTGSMRTGGGIGVQNDTYNFSSVSISNMIFYDNEIDINLRYGSSTPVGTAIISNSTFIFDRNFPTIETLTHPTTVTNCIFIDGGEGSSYDISFPENESLTISHSLFFPSLNNLGAHIDGGANIVTNPLFCDSENGNYSLASNSPAIGAGEDGSIIGALGVGCDALSLSLTINEIMNNPSAVSDSDGEWFEVYNNGDVSHDLNGWKIKDGGSDSHVVSSSLVINPGEFKVLSNNSNQSTNGGLVVDYQYDGITLANGDDELVLIDPNGTVFDSVAYDGGPEFPDLNGASMGVIDSETDNNVGSNWQASTTAYGDGDLGTPGLPNFSSDINVELTTIDFDTVLVGESSDKVLTISNTGNTTLLIDSIYTSSGSFTLPFTETSVETSLELTITFTPSAYGIVEDTLVIKTNDPDEGHLEIPLIAFGYVPSPNIVLETTSIDFGTVMDGLTETIELHVANDGDAALSLSSVYIEGSTNFTIPNFSASIAETDTGLVDIQFSPDDETSFSGTLYIVSNDPDTDTLMVALSGIGGEQAPIMTLSDNELYFGTVETGTTVEREVIIYNEGMLDLEIEEITITGSDYYTTTFSDGSVEPGDSVIVPFSFAPTEQVAEIIATATIASNVGTQTVELKAGYFGPVWHVATTGSDETGDGTEENPFATIQKAIGGMSNGAIDGDTIMIANGNYGGEAINLGMGNENKKNIHIIGESMDSTIFSPINNSPSLVFMNGVTNTYSDSTYMHIYNLTIEGKVYFYDIEQVSLSNVKIISETNEPLMIAALQNYDNYNPLYYISNSIFINDSDNNNTLIAGTFSEFEIKYSTFIGSTSFNILENSNPIEMRNSIIWGDSLEMENPSGLNASYSIIEGGFEGAGNINIDPLFCDFENGDFSLAENSPAIGAGENGTNIGAFGVGCESTELSIEESVIPVHYTLHQNYPNPFNPTTKISYDLPEASVVSLSIYDLMGRKIRTLINSEQNAGFKNIQWNATDNLGKSVPAGMYIYIIQVGEFRQTRKMVLLK